MKLDFASEAFTPELFQEMVPLIVGHFQEIARFKDLKIEPDFQRYSLLQMGGQLRLFTARNLGKLVGYSVFVLLRPPHFQGTLQAHEELLFLDPSFRKGSAGEKLVAYGDDMLKASGAKEIYRSVSVERDYSPLLMKLGYGLSELLYARRVN